MLHVPFFSEKLSFFFSGKCRQFSKKRQFFSGLCMGISGPRYATLVKEGSPHFHIRSPKYSISHRARCRCMAYGELISLFYRHFIPPITEGSIGWQNVFWQMGTLSRCKPLASREINARHRPRAGPEPASTLSFSNPARPVASAFDQ